MKKYWATRTLKYWQCGITLLTLSPDDNALTDNVGGTYIYHGQQEADVYTTLVLKSFKPDLGWKWAKWTFGFWRDLANHTAFGIDFGPLEIVWRYKGYRP